MKYFPSMADQLPALRIPKQSEYLKKPKLAPSKSLWAGGRPRIKWFKLLEMSSAEYSLTFSL